MSRTQVTFLDSTPMGVVRPPVAKQNLKGFAADARRGSHPTPHVTKPVVGGKKGETIRGDLKKTLKGGSIMRK